jgi:membrane-bound lytic murein transglycosylase MltF
MIKLMKRILIPLLLLTLGVLVVLLYINNRPADRDLQEVLQDGRLTVLIESGEHGFTRDSIKVAGFQYEIIKRYADQLGVEMVILQEPNHERGAAKLLQRECDIIVSLQPMILDTAKAITSLLPLLQTNLMLVQLPDSSGKTSIRTQHQLDQQVITLTNASPYKQLIERMANDLAIEPIIQETAHSNIDVLIMGVSTGSVAFTVCPEYLVKRLAFRYPQVDMSLPLTFHLELGWTTRRNAKELQQSVNTYLSELIVSPEYQLLLEKYFYN